MGISYDQWKTEHPDLHAPDPPPDVEAVDEIHYYVKSSLIDASGDGRTSLRYDENPGRWEQLVACCADIVKKKTQRPDEYSVVDLARHGHYTEAVQQIERYEVRHFGGDWQDRELNDLKNWLIRRTR